MNIVHIPKKNGGKRLIYVPDEKEKEALRLLVPGLTQKCTKLATYAHAFVPGRSAVTNAKAHVGFQYTYCFDLKDFFDSVKPAQVAKYLTADEISKCFVDGAPRQGLPTSPAVANLAGIAIDEAITRSIKKMGIEEFAYTRYADDLAVSFNSSESIQALKRSVQDVVNRSGFKINQAKTRLLWAGAGRRVICGVAIDNSGSLHPARKFRRRLRAALHTAPMTAKTRGMLEWEKMKLPLPAEVKAEEARKHGNDMATAKELIDLWNLEKLPRGFAPFRPDDVWMEENIILTRDPAYLIGLSNFTDGTWTSCMFHPSGAYNKGAVKWFKLEGAYIAAVMGEKYTTAGKVSRRQMLSRALVMKLTDGKMVWVKVYPADGRKTNAVLIEAMEKNGIMSVVEAQKRGIHGRVAGRIPKGGYKPYLDPGLKGWVDGKMWGVKI